MDINKKKNRKQISTFHAAEVMSHDLSLLRGKKFSAFFDDSEVKGLLSADDIEKEVHQLMLIHILNELLIPLNQKSVPVPLK